MHQVKRAIIIAAGKGKRMQPLTNIIAKPLVKVNGVPMIMTVIKGLYANGITEIYIVVGYLREQFESLKVEYPELRLIFNPYYDTCNNISSLYVARNYIENAIILDADLIVYNQGILSPYFECSGYNAIWTEETTEEWLMTVEEGIVTNCSRTGGRRGWQLFSISRWSKADGRKLKQHLEIEFDEKKNRQIYWDDVVMFCYPKEYQLGIYEMYVEDIMEIDNLNELIAVDKNYIKYLNGGK